MGAVFCLPQSHSLLSCLLQCVLGSSSHDKRMHVIEGLSMGVMTARNELTRIFLISFIWEYDCDQGV